MSPKWVDSFNFFLRVVEVKQTYNWISKSTSLHLPNLHRLRVIHLIIGIFFFFFFLQTEHTHVTITQIRTWSAPQKLSHDLSPSLHIWRQLPFSCLSPQISFFCFWIYYKLNYVVSTFLCLDFIFVFISFLNTVSMKFLVLLHVAVI